MLTITIPGDEYYDDATSEFITNGDVTVELEHSLVSLSKWESRFEKPFLGRDKKTTEEVLSYIECMLIDPNIPPEVFSKLSQANLDAINNYIDAKMTATWFSEIPGAPKSTEIITSELIYYWLISYNIPFETENWHLNRLFTLIKVCSLKNAKPKKMTRSEIATRNRQLNEQRKAQLGTKG